MDINEQPLTKKQRRELKKQDKLETKNKEKSKKIRTQILVWVGILVIIGVGIYLLLQVNSSNTGTSSSNLKITESDNTWGNPDSSVVLVEYSDFQCPACATFHSIVNELKSEYSDKIYFAFRDFPLRSIHKNAQVSAQAAEAAKLQGKFWEMHDKLFGNQTDWSNLSDPSEKFIQYASELELDIDKFKTDYDSDVVKNKVNNDYNRGITAKVNATPTFFLNGEKLKNPSTLEDFKTLIDEQLATSQDSEATTE